MRAVAAPFLLPQDIFCLNLCLYVVVSALLPVAGTSDESNADRCSRAAAHCIQRGHCHCPRAKRGMILKLLRLSTSIRSNPAI